MRDQRLQRTTLSPDDHGLGSPEARVTLLEYGDFECPYCAQARPVLEGLVADDPETFRLVYRHFPVVSAHPHAAIAAEAAEAAAAFGKFWEMHDMLFENQHALDLESLRSYADAVGVPLAEFDRDMRDHRYAGEVKFDFRRGVQDGVNGTPTIFINRVRYDGPRDRLAMLAAMATELSA